MDPADRKTKALDVRGQLSENGYGRALRARRCYRCGYPILAGLDADRLALAVDCCAYLLTKRGEFEMLATGGHTYRLRGRDIGAPFWMWYIDYRSALDIAAHPADTVDVVGTHRCELENLAVGNKWFTNFRVPADDDDPDDPDIRPPY